MTPDLNRREGALLGLALGDAWNAPFEGGPVERLVWAMIGKTREGKKRYTDDTQMSLDLAESLLAHEGLNLQDLSKRFASHYAWSRGYGGGAAKLLKRIKAGEDWEVASRAVYPEGSFGNGGAMRAPVIGVFFAHRPEEVITQAARDSARVTHAHELGMQGAVAIAHAVASALIKEKAQPLDLASAAMQHLDHRELVARFERACSWLADAPERLREPREVRRELGNGMTALTSCATATYIACAHLTRSFEELLLYARACGGDTDTISAMAGAIWGASRGADDLPQGWFEELEDASHLRNVARALGEASGAVE